MSGRLTVLALWLWALGLPAAAQVPEEVPTLVTVPVGPVLLHPFGLATMERTDNLFQQRSGFRERATVTTLVPGFVAQLPFSHSSALFGYALRHRDYALDRGTELPIDPRSHYLRAETRLVFGTGWNVSLRDDFRRGVLDTQIFEGGEIRFTGEKLQSNRMTAEVGLDRSAGERQLRLSLERLSDRVVGERRSGFFDVREDRASLLGEHRLSPSTWLSWGVEGRDGERSREDDLRLQREVRGRVGGRRRIPGGSELEATVGAVQGRFSAQGRTTERNLVGSAGVRVPFDRTGVLALRLQREVYPSVLEDPYYVANGAQLEMATAKDARIGLGTSVALYANSYPGAQRGRDRTLAAETWIGYRLGRWLETRLTFRGATRSSTVREFGYDASSVALEIRMGAS